MGLCQGMVPSLLSQGCTRLSGHPGERPQQPKQPQHPESPERWRGGEGVVGRWQPCLSSVSAGSGACPVPGTSLGQPGAEGMDGPACDGPRWSTVPRGAEPSSSQAGSFPPANLLLGITHSQQWPHAAQHSPDPFSPTHGSAGSTPSSKQPVRGLWMDPSNPGEVTL